MASKLELTQRLGDPSNRVEGTITFMRAESKAERDHRLAEQAAQSRHERLRDLVILAAVLLGLATIVGLCLWLVMNKGSSPDDRKWATAVLASIVSLLTGYLVGSERLRNDDFRIPAMSGGVPG